MTTTKNGKPKQPKDTGELLDSLLADVEAERLLLGSLFLEPDRYEAVSAITCRDDFHEDRHRRLFEHIANMPHEVVRDESLAYRWITQAGDIETIGGQAYLGELFRVSPTAANAKHYAGIVRNMAIRRNAKAKAERLIQLAHDETASLADLKEHVNLLGKQIVAEPVSGDQAGRSFQCYSMAELAKLDLSVDEIFRHALVRDTPGVFGGREKSLKSLVALDCGMSMATGSPWLGHFECVRTARSVYFAGEGGLTVLRDYARRIAEFKGHRLEDVIGFHVCDEVPNLDDDRDVAAATTILVNREAEFAFFDPLYLMLAGDSNASNVYAMGNILRRMLRACRDAGATPIVLHHFRKSQPIGEAPDLSDLSQAGCAEFAGQWLLINRQTAYDEEQPGEHDLIIRLGSRVGFSSKWAVHVGEGSIELPGGRYWQPTVSKPSDARREAESQREAARAARDEKDLEEARRAIISGMVKLRQAAERSDIQGRVAIRKARFIQAWLSLIDDGSIAEAGTVKKANGQSYPTYQLAEC